MANSIAVIEKQFAYLRKRGIKGDISLTFDITPDVASYFKDQGYEIEIVKKGFFKKEYVITQKGE